MILLIEWLRPRERTADVDDVRPATALGVGLAQVLSLIPGTSRSGVTMTAGLFAGMSREQATRLSFVLAVPVGLLVAIKDGWDLLQGPVSGPGWPLLAVGSLAAALSAYVAIYWLLHWVRRHSFRCMERV